MIADVRDALGRGGMRRPPGRFGQRIPGIQFLEQPGQAFRIESGRCCETNANTVRFRLVFAGVGRVKAGPSPSLAAPSRTGPSSPEDDCAQEPHSGTSVQLLEDMAFLHMREFMREDAGNRVVVRELPDQHVCNDDGFRRAWRTHWGQAPECCGTATGTRRTGTLRPPRSADRRSGEPRLALCRRAGTDPLPNGR